MITEEIKQELKNCFNNGIILSDMMLDIKATTEESNRYIQSAFAVGFITQRIYDCLDKCKEQVPKNKMYNQPTDAVFELREYANKLAIEYVKGVYNPNIEQVYNGETEEEATDKARAEEEQDEVTFENI